VADSRRRCAKTSTRHHHRRSSSSISITNGSGWWWWWRWWRWIIVEWLISVGIIIGPTLVTIVHIPVEASISIIALIQAKPFVEAKLIIADAYDFGWHSRGRSGPAAAGRVVARDGSDGG
jgi:hypothetical protein